MDEDAVAALLPEQTNLDAITAGSVKLSQATRSEPSCICTTPSVVDVNGESLVACMSLEKRLTEIRRAFSETLRNV